MTFADFILQHGEDDPVRLLLARDKYPDVDIDLAATTLEVRRKLRTKVPEWYAVPSLVYPSRLSGEQCSSSETAFYKANVALGNGDFRIADLTGGMGVDAWAFSKVAKEVLYNEMQLELAKATELNFKELGVGNVLFRNREVLPGKVAEVLDGFEPDLFFLDPARRAEDGRKVFLIEDCRPDVLTLLPELFAASRFVMLKLSPMADITMACKRLGHVKEVHVVASGGECKELLFVLDREWEGPCSTVVVEGGAVMEIPGHSSTSSGTARDDIFCHGRPDRPSGYLFEPGKALAKAGAFDLPCAQFGMTKLGLHTHLYVCEEVPEGLRPFGKWFEVLEVLPLNNRTMKEVGKRYPQAEVTARNVPMTSELLRKKTGCTSGGDIHLFGVRIDAGVDSGNYLMISKRITYGND